MIIKLLSESKCLLALFLISISVIVITIWKSLVTSYPEATTDIINNAIISIATGYASGYIIYFLSVLLPKASRMCSILSISKNNFRYAKDSISGIFVDGGGEENLCNAKTVELIRIVCKEIDECECKIEESVCNKMEIHVNRAMEYIQFIILQADYLDVRDLDRIKQTLKLLNIIKFRLDEKVEEPKGWYMKPEEDDLSSRMYAYHVKNRVENSQPESDKNVLCYWYNIKDVQQIINDMKSLYCILDNLHQKYKEENE